MNIIEIFESIQGEGPYIGTPKVFVRFAGCNLKCPWCDTKYSWKKGEEMGVIAAYRKIKSFGVTNVCFTGGEPMAQQEELDNLSKRLVGFRQHIETNGTIPPRFPLGYIDVWVISPKFGHINIPILDKLINKAPEPYMKFVVRTKTDLKLVKSIMKNFKEVPIIIQPERFTFTAGLYNPAWPYDRKLDKLVYLEGMKKLAKWCQRELRAYNWRVLPQLHYLLWGGEKGK